MKKKIICKICKSTVRKKKVVTRSKKKITLFICNYCDFEFFSHNPSSGLEKNKLDKYRLKSAGLKIPNIKKDFKNGLRQSKIYVSEYFPKNEFINKNILEIGCSWGYFLKSVKRKNNTVRGIEINRIRRNFVNKKIKVKCFKDLKECEKENIRYDYIFLFYTLEYITDPTEYLNSLIYLLKKKGRIIIVTPNLNDALKNIWRINKYLNFFYDEHAVNYFSPKSIKVLMKKIKKRNFKILCRQDYSIINHLNWYLNEKPVTSNKVGGDYFIENLINKLQEKKKELKISNKIKNLIYDFDKKYKFILNKSNLGNQIKLIVKN